MSRDGKQSTYLRLPHSSHESAYGWLPIPLTCIKNGAGPTLLLVAGVHGDEYEGQIALAKVIRTLEPDRIAGRVLVLSAMNAPAVMAGNRLSPLDQGNLNRMFPGDPNGSPTQMIAHYVEEVLLAQCDYVVDLHSGGSSLEYLPCVRARLSSNSEMAARTTALAGAFGAPWGVLFRPLRGESRTMSAACERKGVAYINPETGGGGGIHRQALAVAHDGIWRSLNHTGIAAQPFATESSPVSTRFVTVESTRNLVYSDCNGLFEPLVELGDHVGAGTIVAAIHDPERPWQEPNLLRSECAGIVLCRRIPAATRIGDCLFEIGAE